LSTDGLVPESPSDRRLLDAVRPQDWPWPVPAERYNLVVLGGGPAGLVAAMGAVGMGGRVALVERGLLGGDCLNTGCIPSKSLLRVAAAAHAARDARRLGVSVGPVSVDFTATMERMRSIRADIAPHDSAERLREAGVDVFLGHGAFSGPDAVEVRAADGRVETLRFARAVIATGARPARPPIPGLAEAEVLTSETVFGLQALPPRLVVVGAGVVGCELAQAFARLGSTVTLLDHGDRVLSREEPEASALVAAQLGEDGVVLHLGVRVVGVERAGRDRVVGLSDGRSVTADAVLLAVGRTPNLDIGLDRAGVASTAQGVTVDAHLATTNPRVYAAGDVIGQAAYTHAADHQARLVLRNALFFGRSRVDELVIPRVTFTDPEVAAVGMGQAEAAATPGVQTFTVAVSETDRGRTDGETRGYCRVHSDESGKIRGATIVGTAAGELLAPLTLAMTHGLSLVDLAQTVHAYPTRSELVFRVASAFNRTRLTPAAQRLSRTLLGWRR